MERGDYYVAQLINAIVSVFSTSKDKSHSPKDFMPVWTTEEM